MENERIIILIAVASSLVFFVLVLAVITFTAIYNRNLVKKDNELKLAIKNRELAVLRAVIETQSSEREKIANNLHDEVGPLLSTMKLRFFQNQKDFKEGTISNENFKADRAFLDTIIQIVRKVSHDLSPSFVTKFGLIKAIENFINDMEGIDANYESTVPEDFEVPGHISGNLYYIISELVNNLIKHEQIANFSIRFDILDNQLITSIDHNGGGYDNQEFDIFEKTSKGLGLSSIKSRAIIIGAELKFRKDSESPKIEILIPLTTK